MCSIGTHFHGWNRSPASTENEKRVGTLRSPSPPAFRISNKKIRITRSWTLKLGGSMLISSRRVPKRTPQRSLNPRDGPAGTGRKGSRCAAGAAKRSRSTTRPEDLERLHCRVLMTHGKRRAAKVERAEPQTVSHAAGSSSSVPGDGIVPSCSGTSGGE
jgi:hypothetical protein